MKVAGKYVWGCIILCSILIYYYAQSNKVLRQNNGSCTSYANQISQCAVVVGSQNSHIYRDCKGVEVGEGSELQRLIAQDPEVMLFVVYDVADKCTYAYTMSKEKLAQVGTLNLESEADCAKINLHRIVSNCSAYIKQLGQKTGNTNAIEFVSLEISASMCTTNRVWYARANYVIKGHKGVEPIGGGLSSIGVFATLDGEVLKPRRTEYTEYLDKERERFIVSAVNVFDRR